MEVVEFQKRLEEICSYAAAENGKMTKDFVLKQFEDTDIDQDQLLKVIQYLKIKGIQIEGAEDIEIELPAKKTQDQEENLAVEQTNSIPLTPEEEAYLKMYLDGCELADAAEDFVAEETIKLVEQILDGDEFAKGRIMELYLPISARIASRMKCEEMFIEDLIQEANMSLLTAIEGIEKSADYPWLCRKIREGLETVIKEQTQQKIADDCLIAKVEKLEAAVKDLTDDNDEMKFSVNELAIILDMDVDEIRGVLRLTGDDK
ncbi:MAG: hypothetical protein Q4B47_04005 [Eubacteriales bacterium]|nr:hypothetical protein [Eubacteriales bacterium]